MDRIKNSKRRCNEITSFRKVSKDITGWEQPYRPCRKHYIAFEIVYAYAILVLQQLSGNLTHRCECFAACEYQLLIRNSNGICLFFSFPSSAHRASPTLGPDLGEGAGGGGDGPNNGLSKAKELSSMTTVVHTTSIELKLTNRTSVLKAESGV